MAGLLGTGCRGAGKKQEGEASSGAVPAKKDSPGEAVDGGGEPATEYTPRRPTADEEECDEVAREALGRLHDEAHELERRGAELSKQEHELAERKKAIEESARKIDDKLAELGKLGERIDQRIAQAGAPETAAQISAAAERPEEQAKRQERLQEVTAMVGGMPSRRAATLLSAFRDDELAVHVLQALPREQAGKLLGQMDAPAAARLAERIGGGVAPAVPAAAPSPDVKPEAKSEAKSDAKPQARPTAKSEAKPEAKPEAKIDAKADAKPQGGPGVKASGEPSVEKGEPQ